MLTIKDLTILYNSSNDLIITANKLAANVQNTVDDVLILQSFTQMGNMILKVDNQIKEYALAKSNDLSEKIKNLN
tara:strand:- start:2160 stop:2384 length:225 start_codon:yes stop_codon:yes gene_type:complete